MKDKGLINYLIKKIYFNTYTFLSLNIYKYLFQLVLIILQGITNIEIFITQKATTNKNTPAVNSFVELLCKEKTNNI